jgi:hypothetical protein
LETNWVHGESHDLEQYDKRQFINPWNAGFSTQWFVEEIKSFLGPPEDSDPPDDLSHIFDRFYLQGL